MKIEDAVAWVEKNRGMLAQRAKKYCVYAPYDVDDYLQDAREAAIKAAMICAKNPAAQFGGVFFNCWTEMVAEVTPFPDEKREEYDSRKSDTVVRKKRVTGVSQSPPSDARRDVPLEVFQAKCQSTRQLNYKAALDRVKPVLSEKEAVALELAIGAVPGVGKLSYNEIAKHLHVSKDTAAEYVNRALDKARRVGRGETVNVKPRKKPVEGEAVAVQPGESEESHKTAVNA